MFGPVTWTKFTWSLPLSRLGKGSRSSAAWTFALWDTARSSMSRPSEQLTSCSPDSSADHSSADDDLGVHAEHLMHEVAAVGVEGAGARNQGDDLRLMRGEVDFTVRRRARDDPRVV